MEAKTSKKVIFFVTKNVHKFNEARLVLREFGLSTVMLNVSTVEIQNDKIENIALARAMDAVKKCSLPIIVEDAGLFIESLNGFPGPYSSYVFRTIGIEGILKLMENVEKRHATFRSAVVFHSPERKAPKCFQGKARGKIAKKKVGKGGFGFDPIFVHRESRGRTFAEMLPHEKNRYSHRAKAFRKFAEWHVSKF